MSEGVIHQESKTDVIQMILELQVCSVPTSLIY